MAHVILFCNRINAKPRQGHILKKYLFVFLNMAVRTYWKASFTSARIAGSERPGAGVTSLGLVNFQASLWVTEQGGMATCCVHPLGQGIQAEDFPGKCHLCPCSFCTSLCGFCSTVRIPPITQYYRALQKPSWVSPPGELWEPLGPDVFSKSSSQQDQRVWQLAQGRLAQMLLSEGLLPHWLHLPWSLQLEWTFRNHHVHSHLCFLVGFLSDGFPSKTLSALWMSQVGSTCCGWGRTCWWSM